MKTVKAVFKNGVFVPVEPCNPKEGCQAVVVYASEEEPWELLKVPPEKKEALKKFTKNLKTKLPEAKIKVVNSKGDLELFVITSDSTGHLKEVMEEALKVYQETSVYLPLQVISTKRLRRWKEQGKEIYRKIQEGLELK
jgi:predicted DNA-binding antitoxin AbrB/MazE fold protein